MCFAEYDSTYSLSLSQGAYGIGILDLIEAQNWKDEFDFAECYVNWGGYAYSKE